MTPPDSGSGRMRGDAADLDTPVRGIPVVPAPEVGDRPAEAGSRVSARPGQGASDPGSGRTARRRSDSVRRLLDRTKQSPRDSARTAKRIARRAVESIVEDPAPTTEPVPIVAVLRGTQYQAPVEAEVKSEGEARMILDFAVDLGAMMLRAGAGSSDSELAVIAVCTSSGLPDVEVDLTSNSLVLHYTDPEGRMLTVMRVVREESLHFAKLSAIHSLTSELVAGEIDYLVARDRLDAIRRQRRPYPDWLVELCWGGLVACFVNLVGGSWASSVLGFFFAILILRVGGLIGRTGVPAFFVTMGQSAVTTLLAMTAWTFDIVRSPQYVIAAGIVLLLPTVGVVSAVQDALTKFPLTAAARVVSVLMTFAGIVAGIAAAIMIGEAIGLREVEVVVRSTLEPLTALIALVAAFVVAVTGAIGMYGSKRTLLPAGLIGTLGFAIMVAMLTAGTGGIAANFVASTVIGFLCRFVALRLRTLPIALIIPAIFPLLAGLSIFSAAYKIVLPEENVSMAEGLSALFVAITVNAALAVGATFGDFAARPLTARRARARAAAEAASAQSYASPAEAAVTDGFAVVASGIGTPVGAGSPAAAAAAAAAARVRRDAQSEEP